MHLLDLPEETLEILHSDLNRNVPAKYSLLLSGIHDPIDQLKKYIACKFGGFDNAPDVVDGQLGSSELHDCGFRGVCPMEGIVCGTLRVNEHVISPFEIQMIHELATEKTLPAIAEILKVSINTFETRKKILFEKLNVFSRARLVAVCFEKQILTPLSCSA
jgi:DNA-binding CsgD family transcriptional regulator